MPHVEKRSDIHIPNIQSTWICVYIYIYVCVYINICYMYVYIYMYIYIYMYVHTWNSWPERKMFGMSWVVEWFMAPTSGYGFNPAFGIKLAGTDIFHLQWSHDPSPIPSPHLRGFRINVQHLLKQDAILQLQATVALWMVRYYMDQLHRDSSCVRLWSNSLEFPGFQMKRTGCDDACPPIHMGRCWPVTCEPPGLQLA